ncbi:MAG TPA: PAS domain-containing protein, partial [Deltaproteobacteria bacterium]|nr:PAS domain-containing protein [Deltaproteobacteria bacterium]
MPSQRMSESVQPLKDRIDELKRIQDDLRIKEFAIASSINGIAIGNLEGVITYVNRAAVKMWGGTNPAEIIGKPVTVFAESEREALDIMETVLARGDWAGEVNGRRKDGSPVTVLLSASLVRNESNEPVCMMCSFVDITDRKKMEEEMRVKESALASSINGIVIADLDGVITYANDSALKMWGAGKPDEVLGKPAMIFAQSQEEILDIIGTIRTSGRWEGEVNAKRKVGDPFTVLISASLVKNDKGEPICIMCSFVDITDRKKMEEELRIRNNALASSINGIGISDLEGNIIYVNDAALKMWGAPDASEVIGTSALSLAQSEEEAIEIYQAVLEKGGWTGEVSGFRKDGSPITVLLSASLVKNDKGEPICMMDSFVDITERKKM